MNDKPACATAGVDMFPDREDVSGNEAAKAVCRSCPLRQACAAGALERREEYGVWGALTEARRISMHRHGAAPTTGAIARRVAARREEVARLTAQGVNATVIAARIGCNANTVAMDLRALRAAQPWQERAAAKAAARAELDQRIDAMNAAGASIDKICRELHVGVGRVVGRRRAVGVAA